MTISGSLTSRAWVNEHIRMAAKSYFTLILSLSNNILKSRDITLSTNVHLIKAMVFPVVMYGCKSLTIKKAEHWRIDAFQLWYWRRLLRVPWTPRRSNQSILKEISPGCSLEALVLKLKLQYFGHLMWRTDSWHLMRRPWCWERLKEGGEGDNRGRDGWMASLTGWTWVWGAPGVDDGQGGQVCCGSWCHNELDVTEWLNWTEVTLKSWEKGKYRAQIFSVISLQF